jgi:PAS domain S-box-containing protein
MNDKVIQVLSIEDNIANAILIQEILAEATQLGWDLPCFDVEHVSNVGEGLERLKEKNIDVVLSDLDLPDSRAQNTFAKIHAQAPDMPIVVLTGRDDEKLARQTVRDGAEDYLFKQEMSGSLLAHSLIYAIERQQAKQALQKAHNALERRVEERTQELSQTNKNLEAEITERERMENALRESERKYRRLVEQSLQGMVIAQADPVRITFASQPMETITGYSPEELKTFGPRQLATLIHPQDRDTFFENFRARVQGQDIPPRHDYRFIHKSGEVRWVEIYSTRIDYQGKPATQTVFLDITERKRAEEAHRKSEERYRTLVESADEAISTVNEDGVFLFMNGVAAQRLGGKPEDFIGQTMHDLFPPVVADRQLAHIQQVIQTEQGTINESTTVLRGERRWYRTSIQPLRDHQGHVNAALLIASDITDNKQSQEELRRLSAAVEQSNEGWIITDTEGLIAYANPAAEQLYEYDASELIGRPIFSLNADAARAERIQQAFLENGSWSGVVEQKRKDGTTFPASLSLSIVQDEHEQLDSAVASVRDITKHKQVEEALRESNRNLAEAQRVAQLGSWEMDIATGKSRWSDEFFRICGYEPGAFEPTADRGLQIIHPEDRESAEAALNAALEEGQSYQVEKRIVRPDGEVRDILAKGEVVCDAAGQPLKLVGTMQDITERKQVEESLQKVNHRLQAFLDHSPALMSVFDQDGRYQMVNLATSEVLGRPQEAIVGKHFADLLPPKVVDTFMSRIERLIKTQAPIVIDDQIIIQGEERIFETTLFPLSRRGEDSTVFGSIATDITERKRAEEALQDSEERFAAVMNSIEALMYVADMETHELLFVNQYTRNLFGTVEGQICWQVLQKGQEGPCEFCTNAYLLDEHGEPTGVHKWEFQNTRTGRWYHIQDRAIRWVDGRWVRLEVATDITERKRAEEKLERYAADLKRSNEELEQFANVISHDLREPARMVKSFLQLLEQRYGEQLDSKAEEYIAYAVDGAERMQEMIKALLDLSRVGTRGKEPAPTDAEAVLERTLTSLSKAIEENDATVTHDPLPTVMADQAQLAQVFQNLIANGIKFQRDGVPPHVHVSAEQKGDKWLFAVEDNGIGIDPEQTERLFQIFQRLHTREEYEGTGIGLALCRRIVERHGGRIWVESEVGAGSTFYFTLPGSGTRMAGQ